MTRVFRIFFGQQVLTNTQQREDGSTMRYAVRESATERMRFIPGARCTGASQPMQKQQDTRDVGSTTHTLHARRVVFRLSSFPPAGCVDLVHQQLSPDGDYHPRPRRVKNCGCAAPQLLS